MTESERGLSGVVDRYVLAGAAFARALREVRPEQWAWPTPCSAWDVRQLVNHITRGNLSYLSLLRGGTGAEFVRRRDEDALGTDPVGAYVRSARACAEAFARPGALRQVLDYPLGRLEGEQALAVRTADSLVHTWDLARAVGADETLEPSLVSWVDGHMAEIYAGLPETPVSDETRHRFFAAPVDDAGDRGSRQDGLLRRMGRRPERD